MTDNSEIVSALEVLENNRQNDVLDRLTKNNVKVIFYDLALVSFEYSKHFAVSTTDEYGDRYILINSNLMSSPKEALACLIAHESVHELAKATMEEEVKATNVEADTWKMLKNTVSEKYNNDSLVKRLNSILAMQNTSDNSIAMSISNNSFYRNQLAK